MRTIKNRVLTLLLAGLMAGQAILPVSAAENADAVSGTEETSAEMITEETVTDAETETEAAEKPAEATETAEESVGEADTEVIEIEAATEETSKISDDEVTVYAEDDTSSDGEIIEHVYSVDPFDEAYSAGYFCITNTKGHGISYNANAGWPGWIGTNTSRSNNIYLDHYNGACINGVYYDIREYTWMKGDYNYYSINNEGANGAEGSGSVSGRVYREFHFYEAGTLQSENPVEVSFHGVTRLDDNDLNEGYSFEQGLAGIWLNEPTTIKRINTNTWKGTKETDKTGYDKEYSEKYVQAIWAEVDSTPEQPLTIAYWQVRGHQSEVNYQGNSITYRLVENGHNALPSDAARELVTYCVTYGHYSLKDAETFKYYEFNGWYYDEELTQKVPDTIMVSEDQVFYGTYNRIAARIDTEVIGGVITDTVDYVSCGENVTIDYTPNDGCFLDTVTVDGETVDTDDYKDSYAFADIQDDHTIKVVYVKTEEPTKTVTDTNGKDMDGQLTKAGETLVYTISVQNPASTTKTFKVTDTLPDGIEYVSADHDGTYANGAVTWSLDMVAGEKMALTVKAKASKAGTAYVNTATVTVGGIEMTTNETKTWTVADPTKSVKDVDGNDVDGEFLVSGELVTYIITVKNPADDARTFTITDKIPANMEFISADHDGKVANGVITWTIELNGGAEETVRFQAKAMKAGAHYVNSADVTVENIKTTTNKTSNWIMENPAKAVAMDGKDAADAIVEYNNELTYTIAVKNPCDKTVKATITDELPDGVTFVTANHGGQETNGTVTWEITMESKETVELSVVVRVQKISQSTTIINKASVAVNGSTYETNEVENTIRPYKEPETTETHKTVNNETENNKVVNNTTINNTTENNAVKNDTEAAPTETTTVTGYRNVNTGDMARTGLLIAISTAATIGLGIYYYRKRR